MKLPILEGRRRQQKQIVVFRGVHYGDGAPEGTLAESHNLSTDRFPGLWPRNGRTQVESVEEPTALFAIGGALLTAAGGKLYYGNEEICSLSPGEKQFAAMAGKVIIWPDKVIFDPESKTCESLEAAYTAPAGACEVKDGKYLVAHLGHFAVAPEKSGNIGGTQPRNTGIPEGSWGFGAYGGSFLMNQGGILPQNPGTKTVDPETGEVTTTGAWYALIKTENLKQGMIFRCNALEIDGETSWAVITEIYRYFKPTNGGADPEPTMFGFDYMVLHVEGSAHAVQDFESLGFRPGDTVTVSGCVTAPENNGDRTIREIGTMDDGNGNTLYYLMFDADTLTNGTEAGAVSIERKAPALTVICEKDNRLWGAAGNVIYSCALGDPKNWFTYDGLSTDSYAVAVAGDGAFTGCCGYGGGVLFFKEDRMIKILGSYPAQYELYSYQYPGVENGSEKSLKNLGEVIYYKGREGIYAYSGGAPELISVCFGLRRYRSAVAGADMERYYISMQDEAGSWGLWTYDPRYGIFLQEDELRVADFAWSDGILYALDAGAGKLIELDREDSGETVSWSAELNRFDEQIHGRKIYSRLMLRVEMEEGSTLKAEVRSGRRPWKTVRTMRARGRETAVIPILPERCDSFRIRLSGTGRVAVRSLVREFSAASEYGRE